MSQSFQPALFIRFTGGRFEASSQQLNFDIAKELSAIKHLIVKTAEELWKARHAPRARVPKTFLDDVHFRFREVSRGGLVQLLERSREAEAQLLMPISAGLSEDDVDRAIALLIGAIAAAAKGATLPEAFPKAVLVHFGAFCRSLRKGEYCEFSLPSSSKTQALYGEHERLLLLREHYGLGIEPTVQTGYVPSIRKHSFDLYTDMEFGDAIEVPLSPEHEAVVVSASREYERVLVSGLGLFDSHGMLEKFVEVDAIEFAGEPVPWGGAELRWDGELALSKCKPSQRGLAMLTEALPDDWNVYVYGMGR